MKETQNFKKQADMYTGETLEKKKRELAGMQYDLQKMEYEYNMELEKMKVELLKGLVANLKEVIQQIGKEQRYGMILLNDEDPMIESGFIMYGDPQNDLTAVAAKMLNERFKNAPKTDGKKEGKGKSK
jgi:outer membrane protein